MPVVSSAKLNATALPSCREKGKNGAFAGQLQDAPTRKLLNPLLVFLATFNTIRPHSSLNYRPPALQTFAPLVLHLDEITPMQ
jgi:hypothetical protein